MHLWFFVFEQVLKPAVHASSCKTTIHLGQSNIQMLCVQNAQQRVYTVGNPLSH